jgi:hypothetical protein
MWASRTLADYPSQGEKGRDAVLDGRSDYEFIRGAVVVNIVHRDAGTDERRYSDGSGDRLDDASAGCPEYDRRRWRIESEAGSPRSMR